MSLEASSGFTARGKERVNATATELPDSQVWEDGWMLALDSTGRTKFMKNGWVKNIQSNDIEMQKFP